MASNYEIGEAAGIEKGLKACRVLLDKLAAAKRDSAEWKEQHEDLLAMFRAAEQDAARWRYGVKHGFPSHHRQVHPKIVPLGWRMRSQEPPNGTTFFPENYPYYPTAEAAIDAAMGAAADSRARDHG